MNHSSKSNWKRAQKETVKNWVSYQHTVNAFTLTLLVDLWITNSRLNLMSIHYTLWWHTAFEIISREIRDDAASCQFRIVKMCELLNHESPPPDRFYEIMTFLKTDLSSKRWSLDACNDHFKAVVSFWDPFLKIKKRVQCAMRNLLDLLTREVWLAIKAVKDNHSFVAGIRVCCYSAHLTDVMASLPARQTFNASVKVEIENISRTLRHC